MVFLVKSFNHSLYLTPKFFVLTLSPILFKIGTMELFRQGVSYLSYNLCWEYVKIILLGSGLINIIVETDKKAFKAMKIQYLAMQLQYFRP